MAVRRAWRAGLRPLLTAIAAASVAACSGGLQLEERGGGIESLFGLSPGEPTPLVATNLPAVITPETPLLGARVVARDATATLAIAAVSGTVTTWRTGDGVNINLAGPGVLQSTRGIGDDLMASDASAAIAALSAGEPARYRRMHRYIGASLRLTRDVYECTLAAEGPETVSVGENPRRTLRFVERCRGDGAEFVNIYWRDPGRPVVWQSHQWVGPDVGMVEIQRLVE